MTVKRGHLEARDVQAYGGVGPEKLSKSLTQHRYCFENFMQEPICSLKGSLAAPDGSSLANNLVNTGNYTFEYNVLGTQTLLYPVLASDGGYDWGLDQTLADGVEINFGGAKAGHPRNFVATSEDWFARILLNVEDTSGVDAFFGVRKAGAAVATLTEVTDIVGLRALGDATTTTASFTIITNLNNGGTSDYISTSISASDLADVTTVELEIQGVGGKAYVYVNGVNYGGAVYTFDTDDAVSPVARLSQASDLAGRIKTLAFECGLLRDRSPETLLALAGTTI